MEDAADEAHVSPQRWLASIAIRSAHVAALSVMCFVSSICQGILLLAIRNRMETIRAVIPTAHMPLIAYVSLASTSFVALANIVICLRLGYGKRSAHLGSQVILRRATIWRYNALAAAALNTLLVLGTFN